MILENYKKLFFTLITVGSITLFTSCDAYKKLPYLRDVKGKETIATGFHEAKIMPNDILSITVNSTVAGAAFDFNMPVVPQGSTSLTNAYIQTQQNNYSGSLQNYIVDKEGQIEFPVLGIIKIGGMTIHEAQEHIISLIYPRYIPSDRPIVNIRFMDFKVYVLGEVTKPGVYTSVNGQMTILDALAAAGDMTIYGRRNNVLLVRTDEEGNTVFHRINLQEKYIIQREDLYFLQQNDKLYVETNESKGNNSAFGTLQSIGLSAISVLISIIAIATR